MLKFGLVGSKIICTSALSFLGLSLGFVRSDPEQSLLLRHNNSGGDLNALVFSKFPLHRLARNQNISQL